MEDGVNQGCPVWPSSRGGVRVLDTQGSNVRFSRKERRHGLSLCPQRLASSAGGMQNTYTVDLLIFAVTEHFFGLSAKADGVNDIDRKNHADPSDLLLLAQCEL